MTTIEFKRKPIAVPDDEANSATLRTMRLLRGITQKELANAIGIHPAYLSDLENGNRGFTEELFNKAVEAIEKLKP